MCAMQAKDGILLNASRRRSSASRRPHLPFTREHAVRLRSNRLIGVQLVIENPPAALPNVVGLGLAFSRLRADGMCEPQFYEPLAYLNA